MSKRKKVSGGAKLDPQAVNMVLNLYEYFYAEKIKFSKHRYFQDINSRLFRATGAPMSEIEKILHNIKPSTSSALPSTSSAVLNSKTDEAEKKKVCLTKIEGYYDMIRKTINEITLQNYNMDSTDEIINALRINTTFNGSDDELMNIIRDMGFQFYKTEDAINVKFLMENPDIRFERSQYLETINNCRSASKDIAYIGESVVFTSQCRADCLVVVRACNKKGFIGSPLYYKTSDGEVSKRYNMWLNTEVIPNLSKDSVLVFDNGPLRSVSPQPLPPFCASTKKQMTQWLEERGVVVLPQHTKPQLHHIITNFKEVLFNYQLDKDLQIRGHVALRMPRYHPSLNPLEEVWRKIGKFIHLSKTERNLDQVYRQPLVEAVLQQKMSSISTKQWQEAYNLVFNYENYYRKLESDLDKFTDVICYKLQLPEDLYFKLDLEEDEDIVDIDMDLDVTDETAAVNGKETKVDDKPLQSLELVIDSGIIKYQKNCTVAIGNIISTTEDASVSLKRDTTADMDSCTEVHDGEMSIKQEIDLEESDDKFIIPKELIIKPEVVEYSNEDDEYRVLGVMVPKK